MTGRPIRRLLAGVVLVGVVAMAYAYADKPSDGRTATAPRLPARTDSARAHSTARDSADREAKEQLRRSWLGTQQWAVTPGDASSLELTEVVLVDSSAADLMTAFPTIRAMREPAAYVELIGPTDHGRALLVGNVDSLVNFGIDERINGCSLPLVLNARPSVDTSSWKLGVVPGQAAFVAPADTGGAQLRAIADRLLATLPTDTANAARQIRRSWSRAQMSWRVDGTEIVVAARRREPPEGEDGPTQEQVVVAERPIGSTGAFDATYTVNEFFQGEQRNDLWPVGLLHVGPKHRLALLVRTGYYEGWGGKLMIRSGKRWQDAVYWTAGC